MAIRSATLFSDYPKKTRSLPADQDLRAARRACDLFDPAEVAFERTFLVLKDSKSSFGTHGKDTDIEQCPHQGVLRDIVLHYEKDPAWLEDPQDFPQRLPLGLAFELVEGMGAGHGIEAASSVGSKGKSLWANRRGYFVPSWVGISVAFAPISIGSEGRYETRASH